ncbi:methyl-accepting chemotaxis protein [Rhizobium sp. SG570]|uniref:methyl-accepting chemotaxis protein n=1 Tax=Rhizobium sp. SG570 TaxID=2587113 RepID=UPI0017C66219|nr:methyl-accepting chemotaxis protein [Rhizobium sp. SG570]NKJ39867.1 methyl-accepting chemotaxis protein [Rhizobium sp. SG570]
MEQAKKGRPQDGLKIDGYIARAKPFIAITDAATKPGTAEAEVRKSLALADHQMPPLLSDMRDLTTSMKDNIKARSIELGDQTNSTILTSLVTLGVIFIASLLGAVLISSRGIAGPIVRLRERMTALANGDTEAPVEGRDRRDEVGQMAAAVAVFRDNALERLRLEQEADANRILSETERLARETQKAKDDADTQFAVEQLAHALSSLAEGDVGYQIEVPFVAQLDGLRVNFNNSTANLKQALLDVGANARSVDAGASEIRASADDLSKRTEQQASSVEETSAALEQITTTVKDSSKRAEEVGHLVAQARAGAEKSGQVVRNAVVAMKEIERSSDEITNIIGVIDEIAFQTNLLALNAGVEAARAGEAGKGFAVVAQEVRELAQRSAQAAKEIKALIVTSGNHVRSGVTLVDETGRALEVIVAEVQEINRHVDAIVEASHEQSAGLHEINSAVTEIDRGTQQNAAMVEEQTSASHSLARDAASLNQLLSRFQLEDRVRERSFSQPVKKPDYTKTAA